MLTIRVPRETYEKVEQRAALAGASVNEWMNRVVDFALVTAETEFTVIQTHTTTKKVTL